MWDFYSGGRGFSTLTVLYNRPHVFIPSLFGVCFSVGIVVFGALTKYLVFKECSFVGRGIKRHILRTGRPRKMRYPPPRLLSHDSRRLRHQHQHH